MLEMKITITAADLATAINNLAAALSDKAPHFVCTQNGGNSHQIENVGTLTMNMGGKTQPAAPVAPVNPAPAPTTSAQAPGAPLSATPAQTVAPAAPTVPVAAPAPTVQTQAQAPTVPTSAPQYTLEMIANAGTSLIDAGKMDQLIGLLGKFGVASLTELQPSSYGAVASELRTLGAAI